MNVVAYAVCRTCAAVFHAERRCPRCASDAAAAEAIAAATAHAAEPAARHELHRTTQRPPRILMSLVGVTALMLGLGFGLAWLIVHQTSVDETTMSSRSGADR